MAQAATKRKAAPKHRAKPVAAAQARGVQFDAKPQNKSETDRQGATAWLPGGGMPTEVAEPTSPFRQSRIDQAVIDDRGAYDERFGLGLLLGAIAGFCLGMIVARFLA